MVAEGHFKEACTNCYYGGAGSRCSLRHGMCISLCLIFMEEETFGYLGTWRCEISRGLG